MSDNKEKEKPGDSGGKWTLLQYAITAIGVAIAAVTLVFGYIVYMAINGSPVAIGMMIILLVLLVLLVGAIIVWGTLWINQGQDERSGAQLLKVMQYSQLTSGSNQWGGNPQWQAQLNEVFKALQQGEKARQEQLKTQALIEKRPQIAPVASDDPGDYLEIDGLEVKL